MKLQAADFDGRIPLHYKHRDQYDSEVRSIVASMFEDFDFRLYGRAFSDTVNIFLGAYPGYRACNTPYHDLDHTLHVLLASARLAHGFMLGGNEMSPREAELLLLSALMHDIGYIQEIGDDVGTGAKYTLTHVGRGIEFMRRYFSGDLSDQELELCAGMLKCTDLGVELEDIPFRSSHERQLGCLLGTADLVGQMADDVYVEKLVHLYTEFEEGGVDGFESEYDLLKKTTGFYKFMKFRLEHHLEGVYKASRVHFKHSRDMDMDLYDEAIRRNIGYLTDILEKYGWNYRVGLARAGARG